MPYKHNDNAHVELTAPWCAGKRSAYRYRTPEEGLLGELWHLVDLRKTPV